MVSRLIVAVFTAFTAIMAFLFHVKNNTLISVDYVFGIGDFKISWIIIFSMLLGASIVLLSLIPFSFRQFLVLGRLRRERKKLLSASQDLNNTPSLGKDRL